MSTHDMDFRKLAFKFLDQGYTPVDLQTDPHSGAIAVSAEIAMDLAEELMEAEVLELDEMDYVLVPGLYYDEFLSTVRQLMM